MNIDWKWLIIGLLLGWLVVPALTGRLFVHASAAKA